MTQFEKDFVLKCLDFFNQISSNPKELNTAVEDFSEKNYSDPRYHSNSIIPEGEYWSEADKLNCSAAIFESTARANYYFLTQLELTTLVSSATLYWHTQIVPLLLTNTSSNNRLHSITNNCTRIQVQINREIPSDCTLSNTMKNPYVFFSTVAVGIAVAAVSVTLALNK